jgi:hypothetical protein
LTGLTNGRPNDKELIAVTIHLDRTRRRLITLAALPVLALAIAACSGGTSTGRQVANLPGGTARQGSGARLTQAQSDQDMVDFAHCMRSHGVQMPDPFHRPGHAGLSIDIPSQTAATRPAFAACTHFIEPIIAMKNAHAQSVMAPLIPALTRYARCMRGHDINMLDPTPQGALNLGRVPGISSDFGRYSPQFRAADTACRHFLPASVHDDGTGP